VSPGTLSGANAGRRWKNALLGLGFLTALLIVLSPVRHNGTAAESVKPYHLASRTVAVAYRMHLPHLPANARKVAVWIPLPRETWVQRVEDVRIEAALPHRVVRDPAYGNRFLYLEAVEALPESLDVLMEYIIRRNGYEVRGPTVGGGDPEPAKDLARFLQPDLLVPTDGEIAGRSANILSGAGGGNLERARLLYDHILSTMKYHKNGVGWGKGDALYACRVGSGNCTDFHSLFIGMARAAGIPARFVMGFPLPTDEDEGQIPGYHCWAEFHDERLGWVPIDASEAWRRPEQREFFYGGLDANRIEFTIGRDIPLMIGDEAVGAVLNYSIYPHVVVNGAVFEGAVTRVSFRNLTG
jgi:transglutaminase-like putative cysteine protease